MLSIPTDTILTAGIIPESITDGPGVRFVIFTQGCPHHCPGCHNPETHPTEGAGVSYSVDDLFAQICANGLISGVTFSGGEPFLYAGPLAHLAKKCRQMGKNVMVYTGYLYEDLLGAAKPDWNELLAETDFLVDGPYIQEERSLDLLFRGSKNQRIIDLTAGRGIRTEVHIPGAVQI